MRDATQLCDAIVGFWQKQFARRTLLSVDKQRVFMKTLTDAMGLAAKAHGGFALLITDGVGYKDLANQNVDFQVTDRNDDWPKGYLTQKLEGLTISDEAFQETMLDFADHTKQIGDKWLAGHEAAGLPKDGYTLLNIEGQRRLCAARIIGLANPPLRWERVGTRHLTGLAAIWALRRCVATVIIRSDSGMVRVLCPTPYKIWAWEAKVGEAV